MKAIIYASVHHGNTKKILDAIAYECSQEEQEIYKHFVENYLAFISLIGRTFLTEHITEIMVFY